MPADLILLGLVVVGFVVSVPILFGAVGVLLWGTTRKKGRGRREA